MSPGESHDCWLRLAILLSSPFPLRRRRGQSSTALHSYCLRSAVSAFIRARCRLGHFDLQGLSRLEQGKDLSGSNLGESRGFGFSSSAVGPVESLLVLDLGGRCFRRKRALMTNSGRLVFLLRRLQHKLPERRAGLRVSLHPALQQTTALWFCMPWKVSFPD